MRKLFMLLSLTTISILISCGVDEKKQEIVGTITGGGHTTFSVVDKIISDAKDGYYYSLKTIDGHNVIMYSDVNILKEGDCGTFILGEIILNKVSSKSYVDGKRSVRTFSVRMIDEFKLN